MGAITPHPDTDNINLHHTVYWKKNWTDEWQYAPYFEPLAATQAVAPTISTATFITHYGGQGYWEDMQEMLEGSQMQSYLYYYIQIRIQQANDEIILWTGIIPTETFQLLGQSGSVKTADQVIAAQGLEILLQNRLDGAWVKPVGGDIDNKVWISNIPSFNQRYEYGGDVIGNRSSDLESENLTYIFASDGQIWHNYEIAEYLLANYNYENGPQFFLTGEKAIETALNDIIGVYDFSPHTVLDALNILISRGRGFGWKIKVMPDDNDVYIVPFSLLDEEMKLGNTLMPANPEKVSVDLWTKQEHIDVQITGNTINLYDRIVVQGARMKSCCTLSIGDGLEKGWTDNEETAFKDAAKNVAGYSGLSVDDKAALNDMFRASDRFERVFTTFRVPHNWNWLSDGKIVSPWLDVTGQLHLDTPAPYWNADKRFATLLPFQVGFDYNKLEVEPVDNNPADSEPVFRRPFILVKDKDGKYQYAEKLQPIGAHSKPLPREMAIDMHFHPRYLAAKNHWTGAEPGEYEDDIEDIGVDYEDILVTAFIETDQVIQVVSSFKFRENQRTLVITIPDAELWYITPGTIIDVAADGGCLGYGGTSNLLRDDRERLRMALKSAKTWYGKKRNKIDITIKLIDPGIPIGTLINNDDIAGMGAIGSVVTELSWDFQNRTTSIKTDFGELDIAGIYSEKLSRNKPIHVHA